MPTLDKYFAQFIRERIYLQNVTPKTQEWYETAWKAFTRFQSTESPRSADAPLITRNDLQRFVVHLRERGVKPVSCNSWLGAMNAFCGWLHAQGILAEPLQLRRHKLEKRLLRLHDQSAIRTMLHYKPKDYAHWRIHTVVCTILDTGFRCDSRIDKSGRNNYAICFRHALSKTRRIFLAFSEFAPPGGCRWREVRVTRSVAFLVEGAT